MTLLGPRVQTSFSVEFMPNGHARLLLITHVDNHPVGINVVLSGPQHDIVAYHHGELSMEEVELLWSVEKKLEGRG